MSPSSLVRVRVRDRVRVRFRVRARVRVRVRVRARVRRVVDEAHRGPAGVTTAVRVRGVRVRVRVRVRLTADQLASPLRTSDRCASRFSRICLVMSLAAS